jgi:hypothetical protein
VTDQTTTDTKKTIDMNAIVADLVRRGIPAYVEQTGGGAATIYAGTPWHEEGYGDRYPATAGPGQYMFGGARPVADLRDFYIGPDDDGDTLPPAVPVDATPGQVADLIAQTVAQYARDPLAAFVREVAALRKDGEGGQSEPYVLESDDAFEALHSLISRARDLLGRPS